MAALLRSRSLQQNRMRRTEWLSTCDGDEVPRSGDLFPMVPNDKSISSKMYIVLN